MARHWRVYHADLPDEAGARVELDRAESHHAWRVLRRRAGDALWIFDGRGREWAARVEPSDPHRVVVRLEHPMDDPVEPPLEVALYQALCRNDRMEWVIQKGTELGLAAIHPLATRRAAGVRVGAARLERWRRIAVEACKQSGRRRVPAIVPVADLPRPAASGLAVLLDAAAARAPLGALLRGGPRSVLLAAGPESGFEPQELARWTGSGWRAAGLGPRTLRAETAGLVAAAILLHRWGDLGGDSPV